MKSLEDEASVSDRSLKSSQLSDEVGWSSSESEFSAFERIGEEDDEEQNESAQAESIAWVPKCDADIEKLMTLPPEHFFGKPKVKKKAVQAKKVNKKKRKKPRAKVVKDSRFKTDIFNVRQAIRIAYRSVPHDDFVKLVNFLLRGLKLIKYAEEACTYFHVDDPSLRHSTGVSGKNRYTKDLLLQMGFICVNHTYWVWPQQHFDAPEQGVKGAHWGVKMVPHDCPGNDVHRLNDMIKVFKDCQKTLHKQGKTFTGHFNNSPR